MLTEVRSGYSSGENLAVDLLNQLKNGPGASDEMKSIIPKNVILQNEPQVHEDGEFGNVLTLSLEVPKYEAIDSEARYMIAATIVATMQSNITGIDAVRVFINSQPAISTSIMKQETFYEKIGNIATLYFPNIDFTYLIPIKRTLSQNEFKVREKRIEYLIDGLLEFESDSAQDIFPSGINTSDLLSIKVADGIAYVDFSSDLILSCDYNETQERMLIYSIVNTLSEFKEIKKVQILINGEVQDSICGNLSAQEPYLPNPGIIQR
jgi:spore germination protein GerM